MSAIERPEWLPEEYDPDAPLLDRLRIIAEIESGIELHVKGDNGVVEIVNSPQHHMENDRRFHLACGTAPDNWRWEIDVPKKEGVPPTLKRVNPNQDVEAYEATKRQWLRIEDVRIFGVDLARYFEPSQR